jgi:Domain of unknown function (DUF4149)
MNNALRFVQVFALGTWVGAIIYFSAVVAQAAFATVSSKDQVGAFVGTALGGLHGLGMIAAIVYLIAAVWLGRSAMALSKPAALGVILMLVLTLASQKVVIPRMDALRVQMGSVDATPPSNPLRARFDLLHNVSVQLESGVLLIGLAALFLTVRSKPS